LLLQEITELENDDTLKLIQDIDDRAEYFVSLAEISVLSERVRSFKRVIFQGKNLNVRDNRKTARLVFYRKN
jgi:hypothetical protein